MLDLVALQDFPNSELRKSRSGWNQNGRSLKETIWPCTSRTWFSHAGPSWTWTCVRPSNYTKSAFLTTQPPLGLFLASLGLKKYSSVFRENRCPPPPEPVYGGNFNHEAVTLKLGQGYQNLISYWSYPIYIHSAKVTIGHLEHSKCWLM